MRSVRIAFAALFVFSLSVSGQAARPTPVIRTDDVPRFFRIYDAAKGHPSASALQRDYIEAGSPGLHDFVPNRIVSGENLAASISQNPDAYERARECLRSLPSANTRIQGALRKLRRLYPSAKLAPVTFVIGAGNSGGTSGPSGVTIGLEIACSADWLQNDLSDRLFFLVMHEYGHVQQPAELNDEAVPTTVLRQSLIEGVAELVAKLTTGEVSNAHLIRWTAGREREIGEAFLRDTDSHNLSAWLYHGQGTVREPGDLGYWAGYSIARSYYDRAHDKRAAITALLELHDPATILAESGWHPGYIAH